MKRMRAAIARLEWFRVLVYAIAGLGVLLLTLPSLIAVIVSFNEAPTLKFPPPGYSFKWYMALFESPEIYHTAWTSLKVAVVTVLFACMLTVPAALLLARARGRPAAVLDAALMSPLILPSIAFGLSLLMVLSILRVPLSFYTLVIGHTCVVFPFVLRTTLATASQLDPAYIEASESLGAGRFYTFMHVTLPLIGSGIAAGAFIAFMMSFDHVPVSLFLADARTEVLPIRLWYLIFHSLDVRAAAVAGLLIMVTFVLLLVMERITGISRYFR